MSETETEAKRLDESSDSSSNAVQNGSSQKINGGSGQERLLYDGKEGGIVNEVGQYPDRPGRQDCIYYLRTGLCGYGTNCRYNHPNYVAQDAIYGFGGELPERDGEPDCTFFLKTGTCKYGSSCKYNHPRDKNGAGPVSFNILGLPLRPEEVPCKYYLRTGQCKFGPACKFHHPQRTVPGLAFPVNGNMPFGSANSPNLPIRAFPALPIPMPTPTYIYDSPMHTPQAFIPRAVSPPHSYFPQQPWNTLTGNIRHTSSNSVYGSSPSYSSNSESLCESGSNGKVQRLSFFTHYPERPDLLECRNFANYGGSCKYGLDCKFNHPTERIGQMLPRPLIPFAYPGQPLCSSFIACGVCRSGPVCKFCHQGVGYPMNYGLIRLPPPLPMPTFDEPLSGRKSSTLVISSETSSPSKSTKDLDGVNNPNVIAEKTQHSDTNGHQECTTVNTQHWENTGQKKPEEDAAGTPGDSSPRSSPNQQD